MFAGSDLELVCKDALSVPPATYRWYKDNKVLAASTDSAYSADIKKGTLVSYTHTHTHARTHARARARTHAR